MPDHEREGGDPACRLDRVCPECGRFREDEDATTCEHCGVAVEDDAAGNRPADDVRAQPVTTPQRDRDEEGRARNARPRDGLGRPLPYGTPGVGRQPEGVVRTPERTISEAQELLDDGMPFHAHEVFEDAWKSGDDREQGLWRGLAQLAVGLTHAARGNTKGAQSLLRRGAGNVRPYATDSPHGLDIAGLDRWASDLADGMDARPAPPQAGDVAPVLLGERRAPGGNGRQS